MGRRRPPDDERLRGWPDLWAAVCPDGSAHGVEPSTLGEYAALLQGKGASVATRVFPAVAAHLAAGCAACERDLAEALTLLGDEDRGGST